MTALHERAGGIFKQCSRRALFCLQLEACWRGTANGERLAAYKLEPAGAARALVCQRPAWRARRRRTGQRRCISNLRAGMAIAPACYYDNHGYLQNQEIACAWRQK